MRALITQSANYWLYAARPGFNSQQEQQFFSFLLRTDWHCRNRRIFPRGWSGQSTFLCVGWKFL